MAKLPKSLEDGFMREKKHQHEIRQKEERGNNRKEAPTA